MDASKFTADKAGQLVRVEAPEADWAFIPDPLPPKWHFPGDLWPLLCKAHAGLARLDGIGRTLPDVGLLLRPLQDREAIRSSSLEGTYASPQQLFLFELEPREPKSEDDPANAWLEVSNCGKALRQGVALLEKLPLCLRLIGTLHKTLMANVHGRDRTPGEFRKRQVHIGSNRRFIPPPPNRLNECLDAFEKRLNEKHPEYDPLICCYLLHYQFEAIHPFLDGNGRVGRLLMSLMAYKWCGLANPWLYLSPFFDRYKDEYIDKLFNVSSEGDWKDWVEFCLRGTIEQTEDSIRRCDALRRLKDVFVENAGAISGRSHAIIEGLFVAPLLRIPDLCKKFSVTYPTAAKDVQRLMRKGILKEVPRTRPKAFYSPEIFSIAYAE